MIAERVEWMTERRIKERATGRLSGLRDSTRLCGGSRRRAEGVCETMADTEGFKSRRREISLALKAQQRKTRDGPKRLACMSAHSDRKRVPKFVVSHGGSATLNSSSVMVRESGIELDDIHAVNAVIRHRARCHPTSHAASPRSMSEQDEHDCAVCATAGGRARV